MKYSLMIGRFQPWHLGHMTLAKKVLDEGRNLCIAIRDTKKDKDNPYSFRKRKRLICKSLWKEIYSGKVKIIKIPDTEDLVHGRKVGWKVREIKLDKEIENISATKIRDKKI